MITRKNMVLLSTLVATGLLVGCTAEEKPEVEVIDEVIVDEVITSKNEEVIKENNQTEIDNDSKDKEGALNEVASKEDKSTIDSNTATDNQNEKPSDMTIQVEEVDKDNTVLVNNPVFKKSDITDSIKARMEGKSMKDNNSISYDDLSYLTITHLDYNGNAVQGEMVVHEKLADEVLEIFKDLYYAKFPIERMRLVDDYNAIDHASMVNNNSSAFCYRTIAGTDKVSNHGMGVAIDINPFYNPHVLKKSGTVNPPEASKYADRSLNAKGMIKKDDVVYKAFTSRGWTWGGNWNNPDYQHFEKKI